jgi:sodium transport system permease protein
MLTEALIIARKELVDHLRDRRALGSSVLYALMGPGVILLALAARGSGDNARTWGTMAAVFALMAAFTGAMGPATDMIAGERERRTLLPLIVSASSRSQVIVGKWIAASLFGTLGLLANLLGFVVVFSRYSNSSSPLTWLLIVPALFSFALLAGAVQTLVSAFCRSSKEAHTYLSMLMFLTMGFSMWLAFRPETANGWLDMLPLAGQQRLLALAFSGETPSSIHAAVITIQSALVALATMVMTGAALSATCVVFKREDVAYGG